MKTNRRKFLKQSAFISAGTLMVPQFVQGFAPVNKTGRKLVIIQFSGGNDGLNTIVPYTNDIYYQSRPEIAIQPADVLKATDELGFNPYLTALKSLYDDGDLAIVNSVGYPNPNRSHFRSMDIWHTASGSNEYLSYGWLGKYMDSKQGSKPYEAIEVDSSLSLAMKGQSFNALATTNPNQMFQTTRDAQIKQTAKHEDEHSNLGYLRKTMVETVDAAQYVNQKNWKGQTQLTYPNSQTGKNFKLTAQLINGGAETEVFYLSIGGFDTHFNQVQRQKKLHLDYSKSLEVFVKDLKQSGSWDNTLIMNFSEFGRRVAQNGSKGTDHGTASNVYMMGGALKNPGFYNGAPDLTDLDKGDLKYQIDFRSVYATIIDNWLGGDSTGIISGQHKKLNIV
ncbi:DUF1501 domain-containing protein [Reichenbachiella versicolor]|uniref:DUF1501 domain-containing protein n=1 Tax=Reichenbachiella versicolor TaxID=1821036 RepID=UPI000D6E5BA1|nr:DUF1501 domain-containing protein [Reichenbachiella versicolor]